MQGVALCLACSNQTLMGAPRTVSPAFPWEEVAERYERNESALPPPGFYQPMPCRGQPSLKNGTESATTAEKLMASFLQPQEAINGSANAIARSLQLNTHRSYR
jgi:hypothetical protein